MRTRFVVAAVVGLALVVVAVIVTRKSERPARPGQAGSVVARLEPGLAATVTQVLDRRSKPSPHMLELGRRRTCKQCRQLADQGAYEQSVKAYQEFIQTHQGHYQIDDAHYAIAEIYDERLFRFPDALGWYRKLVAAYPHSTLVPLARQRIAYLSAHADHDYQPLARFERIRKVELAQTPPGSSARMRVLAEVEGILAEFPGCSLAPTMIYWLANQYRATDPDRAVATYRRLIAAHPRDEAVDDAWIEIGETYYQAGRYREAIAALEQARDAVPARAQVIEAQIGRARRNATRAALAWASWATLLLVVAAATLVRPRGLWARDFRWAAAAFAPLGSVILIGGWLVHEQFASPLELVGLGLGIAASATFGFPFASALARKLVLGGRADAAGLGRELLAGLVGALLGLWLLGVGAYLTVLYSNEHYLTSFGL